MKVKNDFVHNDLDIAAYNFSGFSNGRAVEDVVDHLQVRECCNIYFTRR